MCELFDAAPFFVVSLDSHNSYISGKSKQKKTGYNIRAVFFTDIPTACIFEIKRQKPRNPGEMPG